MTPARQTSALKSVETRAASPKSNYDDVERIRDYPISGLRAILLGSRALGDKSVMERLLVEVTDRIGHISPQAFSDQVSELNNLKGRPEEFLGGSDGAE